MLVSTHTIATRTHGRYLVERARDTPAAGLLVGFHGYGETPERHLAEMNLIPDVDRWTRVSISALHRFYNTKTTEVVASWMTKQNRELAIADNIEYVAQVVAAVLNGARSGRLVYAGFSQGVAMAYRAAARVGQACHGIIALGGDVPADIAGDAAVRLPAVLLGRGTGDEWYTADKLAQDVSALERRAASVQAVIYDGGHAWTDAFRTAAGRFLDAVIGGRGGA